jgi:hypothetical protein
MLPLVLILSQINPFHILFSCFFKINYEMLSANLRFGLPGIYFFCSCQILCGASEHANLTESTIEPHSSVCKSYFEIRTSKRLKSIDRRKLNVLQKCCLFLFIFVRPASFATATWSVWWHCPQRAPAYRNNRRQHVMFRVFTLILIDILEALFVCLFACFSAVLACCNHVYLRLYHGEQLRDGMWRFVRTIISVHVVWCGVR